MGRNIKSGDQVHYKYCNSVVWGPYEVICIQDENLTFTLPNEGYVCYPKNQFYL